MPTAIDTSFYAAAKERALDRKIIGWVGTSSNFPNLYSAEEALKVAEERVKYGKVNSIKF